MEVQFISAEDTYQLRHHILRPSQPVEACHFPHDHDADTFHLGFMIKNFPVCIASFYLESHKEFEQEQQYRLRGMATVPEFRHHGYGTLVLHQGLEEVKSRGGNLLWFNARQEAFSFYESMGFQFHGPLFEIETVGPHKVMFLDI